MDIMDSETDGNKRWIVADRDWIPCYFSTTLDSRVSIVVSRWWRTRKKVIDHPFDQRILLAPKSLVGGWWKQTWSRSRTGIMGYLWVKKPPTQRLTISRDSRGEGLKPEVAPAACSTSDRDSSIFGVIMGDGTLYGVVTFVYKTCSSFPEIFACSL